MSKKKDLKGKFIIAWDTICDGWQCSTDDDGKPDPELYDSEADAMHELFGDALAMFDFQTEEDLEDSDVTPELISEMERIFDKGNGDPQVMSDFLDAHPECNYNEEFIVPAEEFIFGRKAFFTGDGVQITGEPLQ